MAAGILRVATSGGTSGIKIQKPLFLQKI